ncbi:Methyltransferase domain protein [Candidatus Bilamarchaeum dharawalense]|uniref:Methyltransferase domain protein n=1 Tax=Candidatus Bilamarchaeum dharawalense TaxID=2885759 RepID=A0A5E4LRP4_9ARCH|nr:Methyltransferase domain protein [Candidatus Bilamarchaeum dharawalense]
MDMESDVGVGVVYEQFRLNRLLERIVRKYKIKNTLEAPIYGMAGLTGINSMGLANFGVKITLADKKEHVKIAREAWKKTKREVRFVDIKNEELPFKNGEFDFAYNFAALWYVDDQEKMLDEMCRVSDVVMICMPNPWNFLFQIRKILGMTPRNHQWASEKRIAAGLKRRGFQIAEIGILDIPPWPDTVIPIKSVLTWVGLSKGATWRWSMLDYYMGKTEIEKKVEKYYFIEDSKLPNFIKKLWAHHFYVLATRRLANE